MGRGRAKAKQVKVARQLKYSGGGTDLDRLRAELGVDADHHGSGEESADEADERYDGDDDSEHDDDADEEDDDRDDDTGLVRQYRSSAG